MTSKTFRVARIVYFTDLTRADARVIPLGSLSEILLPQIHALALKARTELQADELACVSPLLRERLQNPFEFLRSEIRSAWDNAEPGAAIDILARRHASSLSVLAPTDYSERSILGRLLPAREDAVIAKLSAAVDSAFLELFNQYGSDAATPRKVIIESEVREAA